MSDDSPTMLSNSPDARKRIASFVSRINHMLDERDKEHQVIKGINADIKEIVAEAKGTGFDSKMIRKAANDFHRMQVDPDDFHDQEDVFELYWNAVMAELHGEGGDNDE